MARIVIVTTSHASLGDTGRTTGYYAEELAAPYNAFRDAGHAVAMASTAGGPPPVDPASLDDDPAQRPAAVRRFLDDARAQAALNASAPVAEIRPSDFDAVFLPGGHGTMWDFPDNSALAAVITGIHGAGGVVGAVCHGPAGLIGAQRVDGRPLVEGRRVSAFTDSEEAVVGLDKVVPFLLESRLRELGADFVAADDFTAHAVRDGRLVTGQNPMSSEQVADLFLEALSEVRVPA